jgi:nucleoside-diphosphate-sugar epimerase
LVRAVRTKTQQDAVDYHPVGNIGPDTHWSAALKGCEVIVHLAARVHVMHDDAADPLTAFRTVNVEGTRRLAEQAVASGVRRLVYISSVKVNGEYTQPTSFFSASDKPAPIDAYGLSKWEAEQALHKIAAHTGLEVVILRPPLVYGSGVKANFARLMALVKRGIPLPLAMVNNHRSLVSLDNLTDLCVRCIHHNNAVGQTMMVADGVDLSTPELIRQIAAAMGRPPRLFPVPVSVLRAGGKLLGRANEVDRLVGSLQINIQATRDILGWTPPVPVDIGIRHTVNAFMAERS